MSEELKPCPFCGRDNAMMLPPTCRPETPYNAADRLFPIVRCGSCCAEVSGDNEDYRGASAIAAWNRRAPSPEVEAATKLVSQWEAFEAGYGNQEEAYYKLAKYARPHWEALRAALRSPTGAKP